MTELPLFVRICILALWMLLPPLFTGCILRLGGVDKGSGATYRMRDLPEVWVCGRFVLWALFWLLCVPCILLEVSFPIVVYGYGGLTVLLSACGLVCLLRGRKRLRAVASDERDAEAGSKAFWVLFALLLLVQLVQAVRLTYRDGDDAYYVAVSSITANADTMYQKLPYTGGTTKVDIRHGLAPLPVWIAFLSRISGVRAVSVAHIAVPLMLIPMTYLIFYLLGRSLFAGRERRIPLFLIFAELLILFGDCSLYTAAHFMIARSRQGKAALGSIVVPMLFWLLLLLFQRLEAGKKSGLPYWALLAAVLMTGCLCTTMGALLCCMLLAIAGACAAVCYRNWKVLLPLAACCVPCVVCAVIYLLN